MKTEYQFYLHKMHTELATPVKYHWLLEEEKIALNPLIGQELELKFTGKMRCIQCERMIKKTFQQGYCYPCLQRLLECNLCMIHPEKCRFYEGVCNPEDWAHQSCAKPHIIYLAYSSASKVGMTRQSQLPTRWIDQGALAGLPIIQTRNRYQAGIVEVALKAFIADKTDWRKMLLEQNLGEDLSQVYQQIMQVAQNPLTSIMQTYPGEITFLEKLDLTLITYPLNYFPEKIRSYNLDKDPLIKDKLCGIKGQYWIFENGVINWRKYGGYELSLKY